jgi:hypothetical protein
MHYRRLHDVSLKVRLTASKTTPGGVNLPGAVFSL